MNPTDQNSILHGGNETVTSQLKPAYTSSSDFRNYLGFLREKFLSPAILTDERCLVFKGLGFRGLSSPDLIVTLDQYQGFKYNKDPFISTIHHHRDRLERQAQRSLLLAKKRSKSHGSAPLVESKDIPKERRFTSYEPQSGTAQTRFSMLSFNLLPRRKSSAVNFNLLANQEDSSSNDNAIEEDDEEDNTSEDLSENNNNIGREFSKGQISDDVLESGIIIDDANNDLDDQCMIEDDEVDDDEGDQNLSDLNYDDDGGVESSEEEDLDPYGQGYGYPYANKVPVIDIVVSDGEYEFDQ